MFKLSRSNVQKILVVNQIYAQLNLFTLFYLRDSGECSEVLGWASAQVVCICSINPQKVLVSDSVSNPSRATFNSTSLSPRAGERGLVIFSTKPKILVCDLKLPDDSCSECKRYFLVIICKLINLLNF
jgi:hypothetical protein